MRVLVLSVTVGGGHNSAARAIADALLARGAEVDVEGLYSITSPIRGALLSFGYGFATSYLPRLYRYFYRRQEKRSEAGGRKKRVAMTRGARRLAAFLDEKNYGAIVFTHVFCGRMLDLIRRVRGLDAKIIGVVTDFYLHPFWEGATDIDRLAVANEKSAEMARARGFSDGQIIQTGIPVSEKFLQRVDKREARRTLSLSPDLPTAMVMSGSMGYGKISGAVGALLHATDAQIVAVCGKNKREKRRIERKYSGGRVRVFGFSDKIDIIMSAADVVVTKPGGISTGEAMAKGVPTVLYGEIPGQEAHNAKFLTDCGAAVAVKNGVELCREAAKILADAEVREKMTEKIPENQRGGACEKICREILG